MKTPYGEINVGDMYVPADGSPDLLTVVDVETYADVEDVVVNHANGDERRYDWFKLMYPSAYPDPCRYTQSAKCRYP